MMNTPRSPRCRIGRGLVVALSLLTLPWFAQMAAAQGNLSHGAGQIPVPLVDVADPLSLQRETDLLLDRLEHSEMRGRPASRPASPQTTARHLSPLHPSEPHGFRNGSLLRIDGERRSVGFSLFLSDPDAVQALRIATASSINVLPERSRYEVHLNGVHVGSGRLEHFSGIGALDLRVEPGMARVGLNAVRIEFIHHHRIFCGPEAAFAMWSDIDLARSGAVLAGETPPPSTESFLMGLASASASGAGLDIRGSEILGAQRDAWVGALTRRIAETLGGDPIPFRFSHIWSVAPEMPVGARITFQPAEQTGIRFVRGGDGAEVMVIGVAPGADAPPLDDLDRILPQRDRLAGVALIDTIRPVPLSDMGFRSQQFWGRYALSETRFRLPDDYVVLTNLKAFLHLTYVFAEDLPDGAMLQVHVNGTNIRLLPLWTGGGRMIEDFPIRFEARYLRGGENTLAFEMFIPGDPPDLPCPQREGPVLAIADSSTLTVPYSPSMYLADMHFVFSALGPEGVLASDLSERSFSDLDRLQLQAAFSTGQRADAVGSPARLHLIPPDDLGAVPSGSYVISRGAVEAVLARREEPAEPVALAATGNVLFRAQERRESRPALLTAGWDWTTRRFDETLQWMHPRAGTHMQDWLARQSGQAILLQLDPLLPSHVWMLRAPDSDITGIAAAIVTARALGDGPRGQVSVLDHEGHWQNWYAPDRQPILVEPLSIGNIRHVMGNFVSATPIRFVSLLFLLALISAVFALRLIIATREHRA